MANGFDCVGMMYGIPGAGGIVGILYVLILIGLLGLISVAIVYLWTRIQAKKR